MKRFSGSKNKRKARVSKIKQARALSKKAHRVKKRKEAHSSKADSRIDLLLLLLFIVFTVSAAVLFILFILDKWGIIEVERWLAPLVPSLIAVSIFFGNLRASATIILSTRTRILVSLASFVSLVLAVVGVILIRKLKKMPLRKELIDIEQALKKKIGSIRNIHQSRALHLELRSYETEIDALYQYILKKEKINLEEVTIRFKISKELAEEWAKILESHKLITINYSPFGAMILTTPQEQEEAK